MMKVIASLVIKIWKVRKSWKQKKKLTHQSQAIEMSFTYDLLEFPLLFIYLVLIWIWIAYRVKITLSSLTLCNPLDSPRNSPGQNTGVGSLSLLQRILPNQGLNPGFPHCRRFLYQLSHQGSPILFWIVFIIFLYVLRIFCLLHSLWNHHFNDHVLVCHLTTSVCLISPHFWKFRLFQIFSIICNYKWNS